jgi:hypothetical protein
VTEDLAVTQLEELALADERPVGEPLELESGLMGMPTRPSA